MLEVKIENPINLKLSDNENVVILEDEKLPLEKGVVFGGEHYGFNLILEKDGESTIIPYGTQCKIGGVQITEDILIIIEDNKYVPWRFNKNTGDLINEAVFSFLKKTEIAYLRDNFGIVDEEGLARINEYNRKTK